MYLRHPRELLHIALSGAAMGASWMCLFEGYVRIGVGMASLLYYCGPVIVMALSPLLFHERLTRAKLLGFAAVFASALLRETMLPLQILGAVLILCGAAGAECVPMLLQRHQKC